MFLGVTWKYLIQIKCFRLHLISLPRDDSDDDGENDDEDDCQDELLLPGLVLVTLGHAELLGSLVHADVR